MPSAENRQRITELCGNGLVLDIGGWVDPVPRADYVVDLYSYETRALYSRGLGKLPKSTRYPDPLPGERFTRETWIQHDICGDAPFPFPDKMFDFVLCSHTLEDVRQPARVCREIVRIGKAGYIETPSRLLEQTRHFGGAVGADHHHWMVEGTGSHVVFREKPCFLPEGRKYSVPYTWTHRRPKKEHTFCLFWNDRFTFEELPCDRDEARRFVERLDIPRWYWAYDIASGIKNNWRSLLPASSRPPADPNLLTWEDLTAPPVPKTTPGTSPSVLSSTPRS